MRALGIYARSLYTGIQTPSGKDRYKSGDTQHSDGLSYLGTHHSRPFVGFSLDSLAWTNIYFLVKKSHEQARNNPILDNMFTNPTPKMRDWEAFLSQMTGDELKVIARVRQLDNAYILTKEDLVPFVEIMEKYNPRSVGVVYEDHDSEVDLWEKPGES